MLELQLETGLNSALNLNQCARCSAGTGHGEVSFSLLYRLNIYSYTLLLNMQQNSIKQSIESLREAKPYTVALSVCTVCVSIVCVCVCNLL